MSTVLVKILRISKLPATRTQAAKNSVGARELTARRDGWVVLVLWRPADPIIKLTALTRRSPFYDLCQLLRTFQPFQPCGYSKAVLQF